MLTPVVIIVLAALAAGVLRRHVVWVTRVTSWSMAPSLHPGDRLPTWALRDASRIRRGDVVVIESPELGQRIIKRVIGLPGERIVVDRAGVLVDDVRLDEPWPRIPGGPVGSFRVPDGTLLVLGDNRAASSDSRSWRDPYVAMGSVVAITRPGPGRRRTRPGNRGEERTPGAKGTGGIAPGRTCD